MNNSDLKQWLEHTEVLVGELLEDGTNNEVYHTIEHHFASENFETL